MILDESTDLTQFAGQRVVIGNTRTARINDIHHGSSAALHHGVHGNCIEDPHGDCRGGSTAFWFPYGTDLTLENAR